MIARTKNLLTIGVLAVALAGGWFMLSAARLPIQTAALDTGQTGVSGILDGMQFTGKVGLTGKPLDIEDTWNFANGTFVSTECETRCSYPRAPYYVRQQGGAVQFIGETHCLDKAAKISWRGTVENGVIKGQFTWTIARWYWTVEKEFWFEGKLVEHASRPVTN